MLWRVFTHFQWRMWPRRHSRLMGHCISLPHIWLRGYWNIPLDPDSRVNSVFAKHVRQYVWRGMPYERGRSKFMFLRVTSAVISSHIAHARAYIAGVPVVPKFWVANLPHAAAKPGFISEVGLTLNFKKQNFSQPSVSYRIYRESENNFLNVLCVSIVNLQQHGSLDVRLLLLFYHLS